MKYFHLIRDGIGLSTYCVYKLFLFQEHVWFLQAYKQAMLACTSAKLATQWAWLSLRHNYWSEAVKQCMRTL